MTRNAMLRAGLFGTGQSSGPPRETEQTAGLDNQELLVMQDRIMKDQDEELVHIEKSVHTVKVRSPSLLSCSQHIPCSMWRVPSMKS